jgi:tRNA (guanosine-2'-O-)-methyltransferase
VRVTDPSVFEVSTSGPLPASPEDVIAALTPMLTEARRLRIEEVAARRTLAVTPVLENVTDPHNTSAILRSADAFGLHRVHVITNLRTLTATRKVAKGTERWLDLVRHPSAESCAARLRADGFRIYVASMDGDACPEDLADRGPVAVVFGNEQTGASAAMRAAADGAFAIPMHGFVESLNVSVAAAITLYTLARKAPRGPSEAEQRAIVAQLMMATVRNSARIVAERALPPG